MKVRFTSKISGNWRTLEDGEYQRAILELCGGGYTEDQTARAIETLGRVRNGETISMGNFTFEKAPE